MPRWKSADESPLRMEEADGRGWQAELERWA
jgi:hypothetical protein